MDLREGETIRIAARTQAAGPPQGRAQLEGPLSRHAWGENSRLRNGVIGPSSMTPALRTPAAEVPPKSKSMPRRCRKVGASAIMSAPHAGVSPGQCAGDLGRHSLHRPGFSLSHNTSPPGSPQRRAAAATIPPITWALPPRQPRRQPHLRAPLPRPPQRPAHRCRRMASTAATR